MKITNYIRTLGNLFGKGTVLEDLRLARSTFGDIADHLSKAEKSFPKFKSAQMRAVQGSYTTAIRTTAGKSLFAHLAANKENIKSTIDTLESIVAGEFDEKIASQGLDYRRANVLQLADAVVFASRFTIKLLTYALKCESDATRLEKKMPSSEADEVLGFEETFIKEGLAAYLAVMSVLTAPAGQNAERIGQIPEILATDANYTQLRGTVGDAKIDPFNFSMSNFRYNPIRAFGMARVESKAARAREAEVELQMAQLRLMQLERTRQGKEDPALEREIRYMQQLVDSLAQEISDYNEG